MYKLLLISIVVYVVLQMIWVMSIEVYKYPICKFPSTWLLTYECHCPTQWRELTANAIITNNRHRIPTCDFIIYYATLIPIRIAEKIIKLLQ